MCFVSGKQKHPRTVFLLTIREARGFEDRAEVAVASTTMGSLVIATCLPNASAKVIIKLSFCCASLHTNAFLLVLRQFFGCYLRSDHSAYRGWYRFPLQVIRCGGGRNTARKSLGFSIEAICFFGTSNRSFI